MDLDWHKRLIDRMIKNNIDATIKDYMNIVDQNEFADVQVSAAKSVAVIIPVTEEYEPPMTKLPSMAIAQKKKQYKSRTKYERKWTY